MARSIAKSLRDFIPAEKVRMPCKWRMRRGTASSAPPNEEPLRLYLHAFLHSYAFDSHRGLDPEEESTLHAGLLEIAANVLQDEVSEPDCLQEDASVHEPREDDAHAERLLIKSLRASQALQRCWADNLLSVTSLWHGLGLPWFGQGNEEPNTDIGKIVEKICSSAIKIKFKNTQVGMGPQVLAILPGVRREREHSVALILAWEPPSYSIIVCDRSPSSACRYKRFHCESIEDLAHALKAILNWHICTVFKSGWIFRNLGLEKAVNACSKISSAFRGFAFFSKGQMNCSGHDEVFCPTLDMVLLKNCSRDEREERGKKISHVDANCSQEIVFPKIREQHSDYTCSYDNARAALKVLVLGNYYDIDQYCYRRRQSRKKINANAVSPRSLEWGRIKLEITKRMVRWASEKLQHPEAGAEGDTTRHDSRIIERKKENSEERKNTNCWAIVAESCLQDKLAKKEHASKVRGRGKMKKPCVRDERQAIVGSIREHFIRQRLILESQRLKALERGKESVAEAYARAGLVCCDREEDSGYSGILVLVAVCGALCSWLISMKLADELF